MFNFSLKSKYPLYAVGGYVRDKLIDSDSTPKDLDLCMVAPSFDEMERAVKDMGGKIYLSTPQYLTIRCKIPEIGDVDVAMARRDGDYGDGRRPDETFIADDIQSDLQRRDFSCNAIAVDVSNGEIIDPFGGQLDIKDKLLKTVGDPYARFSEDYLRLLRAIRFAITKGFDISDSVGKALHDEKLCSGLKNVSQERIREELFKCFKHDTLMSIVYFNFYKNIRDQVFHNTDLWLKPTMEK
jgi:tRNA nucleotidyltransferase (CCA-adding enzyme)